MVDYQKQVVKLKNLRCSIKIQNLPETLPDLEMESWRRVRDSAEMNLEDDRVDAVFLPRRQPSTEKTWLFRPRETPIGRGRNELGSNDTPNCDTCTVRDVAWLS